MNGTCLAALLGALFMAASPVVADSVFNTGRQVTKLGDGIYEIRHVDPARGWVHGNTTVIIGTRAVLVVDSCQTPSAAREDIAQIRTWTNKPVAYLVNTHWHTDHNGGNAEYLAAFPSVVIIAHPETRRMMDASRATIVKTWTTQAAAQRERLNQWLKTGNGPGGKPLTDAERASIPRRLEDADQILADAGAFTYQAPTMTFEREVTLDLGGREAEVRHVGRANTGGDVIVYLPSEKLLAAGDIVVHPVPYAFDGYPSEWIQTLDELARMDVATLVPGHGEILHGTAYVRQLSDLMRSIVEQVDRQLAANDDATLEQVRKGIDLSAAREAFSAGDPQSGQFFDMSIGGSFVELAYHERKQR